MSAAEWESPTRKRVRNRKVLHTTTPKPCDSDYFNPINIGVNSITCEKITADELLFEMISLRYERGSTLITSNLPFDEWTETFGTERLTGALLDRLTHHVSILEMNGDSYRLAQSRARKSTQAE